MKWYEIKAAVGSAEADIFIYDQIGESMFADGVGAKAFAQELAACRASQINLHINSPGGSVFEGTAIYNAIQRHPANVTAYIDGLAASIASVVALAANKVVMARNALFMIHDPRGTVRDATGKEMRQTADVMDKVHDICVDAYTAKTGAPAEVISAAMAAETWYNAQQAKDAGFADEIGAPMELAAVADVATLEALGYHNLPESIRAGACGASDLPLGDKDAAWDGSAARASIQEWAGGDDFDPAKMKQGFFWFDDAKPKNSGSYKLPFATVSGGKLTAMPAGIHAAAGAMSGARRRREHPLGRRGRRQEPHRRLLLEDGREGALGARLHRPRPQRPRPRPLAGQLRQARAGSRGHPGGPHLVRPSGHATRAGRRGIRRRRRRHAEPGA